MSEGKTLEERLAYLEEQNEGLKRVGGLMVLLVLVLGVTLFLVNQSIVKGVDTGALILSNEGRPRAALTAMPNGHTAMVFYNYAGKLPSANFSGVPPLDGLVIYDQMGNPRVLIGVDERNIPTLALLGPDGRPIYSAVKPDQYKELLKVYGGGAPGGANPANGADPASGTNPNGANPTPGPGAQGTPGAQTGGAATPAAAATPPATP